MLREEIGFVGNVWVRQCYMEKAGDIVGGHLHYHDHVSLLVRGSVEVTVGLSKPKVFTAPTFIVIKKEHKHQIKALEDDTIWYCVFAVRDIDGNLSDIYDEANIPNYAGAAPDDYWGEGYQ